MTCLRFQGKETTLVESMWMGMSHLLPGGHTSLNASGQEKIYVVLSGNITLASTDSCRFAPDEPRAMRNDTTLPATILLITQEKSA